MCSKCHTRPVQLIEARVCLIETRVRLVEALAEQQRFVLRGIGALAQRDHRFESQLDELRTRVEALERRVSG